MAKEDTKEIMEQAKEGIKIIMEQFIKSAYPKAELDHFLSTSWGTEYTFYPTPNSDEPYACIIKNGKLTVLTDF